MELEEEEFKETKPCIPSLHTAHEGVELIQRYI